MYSIALLLIPSFKAVSMTLGVEAIEREQLEGSKPSSLAELILNPQAQGPYGAHQLNGVHP